MSAAAIRNSSRRRTAAGRGDGRSGSSARPTAARTSAASVARPRGHQPVVVAEQGDRLGGAQQQVGGDRLLGEQHAARLSAAAPSSRSSRRYQGVLPSASQTLRKREQPGVRVGRVGEPAEQHRQQGPLDRGLAADAGGQRLQVAQRAGRVGVAEGLQPRPAPPRA